MGPDPASHAEHTAAEQRLKDLETFRASVRRRWWIIAGALALLVGGRLAGHIAASAATLGSVVAAAGSINVALGMLLRRRWYARWLIYALGFFDIALVAAVIALYGPGGLVAGFYLAVLPYSFDRGRRVGDVLILAAALGYLGAASLHGISGDGPRRVFPELPPVVYLETAVFIAVALVLRQLAANLMQRIRVTRAAMAEAVRGHLTARATAERSDELGLLERSFNRMLEETAATISEVQREADEVAVFGEMLANHVEYMLASSRSVAETAANLARGMSEQRHLADRGHAESTAAAQDAEAMRSRAELMENDARALLSAAERGRDRVARASETLLSIGHEVRTTAQTVQELSTRSERIGAFTQTIAKIARQTHLLALNAAIEAARAEEHGRGFAAVAEQVRTLAGEAAQSARDMAELISEVRTGIDAVAHAMTAGEEQVRDVGIVAEEARNALQDIHAGVSAAQELVSATSEVSRDQAERTAMLAQQMSEIARISTRSSEGADSAQSTMAAQIAEMDGLNRASRQIGQLADRLRASIARFSVADGEPVNPGDHARNSHA